MVHSTVAGRLRMIFRSGVGCQTSITASQHLEGEIELGVGEGLGRILEDDLGLRDGGDELLDQLRAIDGDVAGSPRGEASPKVTRRCSGEVEL